MSVLHTEPVATASAATVIAGGAVALGQVTGLYSMSADDSVAIVSAVFVLVSLVSSWWARRHVTPTVKATDTGASSGPAA